MELLPDLRPRAAICIGVTWVECLIATLEGRWILRGGGETTREDRGLALLRLGLIGREDTGLIGREGLPISLWELRRGSVIIVSGLSTTIETRRPLPVLLLVAMDDKLESLERSGKVAPRVWREGAGDSASREGNGVYSPSPPSGGSASACSITVPKLAYSVAAAVDDCPDPDDDVANDTTELFSSLLLDSASLSSCPCSCMVLGDIDLEGRLRFPVVENWKRSTCWEGCGGRAGGDGDRPGKVSYWLGIGGTGAPSAMAADEDERSDISDESE